MQERDDRPRINKKAVLAFVLGLLTVVFAPAIIPAIVLWYLALRDLRGAPNQRGIRLARAGVVIGLVMIIVPFSIIVLMIGIDEMFGPDILTAMTDSIIQFYEQSSLTSRLRETRRANEAAVLDTLPIIRDSLNRFYGQYGGYPRSLQELVDAGLLQPVLVLELQVLIVELEGDEGEDAGIGQREEIGADLHRKDVVADARIDGGF